MTGWFELWQDGRPTKLLFLSEANARVWIATHGTDNVVYTIRPYNPK